jgi:ABC-type sugar transport system ATPase subunit
MNFLDVGVEQAGADGCTVTLFHGAALSVPAVGDGAAAGGRLTLGIRPEHVAVQAGGEVEGEIQVMEYLGPRSYVHARLADGSKLVAQAAGDTTMREGDRVSFHFNAEACHLFDGAGKRLERP